MTVIKYALSLEESKEFLNRVKQTSIVKMNDLREIKLPSLSPHILRHTACTRMAESGMDIATLQYIMGHNDIKTTLQTYNHVDIERIRKEIEARTDLHYIYTINV